MDTRSSNSRYILKSDNNLIRAPPNEQSNPCPKEDNIKPPVAPKKVNIEPPRADKFINKL